MVALVQHPDYEQWKAQVAALRQEVASTLEELDHLRNNVRPLLLALYRQKLGVLELDCLREQCRAEWLRRYAERVRAALNKGETVQLAEIGKALDGEMAEYWRRLREMAAQNEAAQEALAHVLPPEKALELRDLFRRLVKRLHPDVNPDAGEWEAEMLRRAQAAYEAVDLEELGALAAALDAGREELPMPDGEPAVLRERARLAKALDGLRGKIAALRAQPPFHLEEKLADAAWVDVEREKLKAGAAAWRAKAAACEAQLKTLLGEEGYGSIRFDAD
jgi:hypothetical protein